MSSCSEGFSWRARLSYRSSPETGIQIRQEGLTVCFEGANGLIHFDNAFFLVDCGSIWSGKKLICSVESDVTGLGFTKASALLWALRH
jgi:hypothetical protein